MNSLTNKTLLPIYFTLTFAFFNVIPTFGQSTARASNRSYLDSILQLLPVLPPQDHSMDWIKQLTLDSLPDLEIMNSDEIVRYAYQLADKAVGMENDIDFKVTNADYTLKNMEQEYKYAKKDNLGGKAELDSLKLIIKSQKSLKDKYKSNQKFAKKVSLDAINLTKLEVDGMRKALPKFRTQVADLAGLCSINTDYLVPMEITKVKGKRKKKEKNDSIAKKEILTEQEDIIVLDTLGNRVNPSPKSSKSSTVDVSQKFKAYNSEEDVMLNPPSLGCDFTVNKTDEFSGKLFKEIKYEEAFRFTNDFMKKHLNGKPHIVCEASLSTLGELVLLNLRVVINETNALKSFGGVNKSGICSLKLINGSLINLTSVRDEDGVVDELGGFCTFNLQFATDKGTLKQLQRSELDKIRIAWKRGFEEYEIYNVDIFKRQANCLLK
jgi:hypothetical protein